jgi:hypothetical protein
MKTKYLLKKIKKFSIKFSFLGNYYKVFAMIL